VQCGNPAQSRWEPAAWLSNVITVTTDMQVIVIDLIA
jgi:hypothetical protein